MDQELGTWNVHRWNLWEVHRWTLERFKSHVQLAQERGLGAAYAVTIAATSACAASPPPLRPPPVRKLVSALAAPASISTDATLAMPRPCPGADEMMLRMGAELLACTFVQGPHQVFFPA